MSQTHALSWLPNALTLARCVLAGGVAWLIISLPDASLWPFIAYLVVAATDFVDGYAARRLDAVSELGAFLDPVADKVLVGACLVALTLQNDMALLLLIPTAAIIVRDLIATGLRLLPGISMPVSTLAKWKTAIEMIAIAILLLASPLASGILFNAGLVLVWLAALLAVYTLGLYIGALIANQNDRANT
nr:CDP-diacylglycerol--glycerol-3-phosphate 3-phosphatidyltransferase [Hyphomonas sp. Mor2]